MNDRSPPISLAIIGAGNRVTRFYTEILQEFKQQGLVKIVGIYNRTIEKAKIISNRLYCPVYSSLEELLEKVQPEAVILSVSPAIKDEWTEKILQAGVHIFLETPASYSSTKVREFAELARKKNAIVEVAEDEAFRPIAQLQRTIIESEILGEVIAVFNDDLEYYYHACARLHILIGSLPSAISYTSRNTLLKDGARVEHREVLFDSGLSYFHRYVSPKRHLIRATPTWRVICDRGVMSDCEIILRQLDGTNQHCEIVVEGINPFNAPEGQIEHISTIVEGREFTWSIPYNQPHWTHQHWGIAHLLIGFLGCLRDRNQLYYGIDRAIRDIEIFQNMESPPNTSISQSPSLPVQFWQKLKSFRP
jgi:hypothetical protein